MTLYEIAKTGSYADLDEYLQSHSAIDPNDLCNALSHVVWREDIKSTTLLVEHGAPLNFCPSDGWPPFYYAVEQRNYDLVKLLHRYGADVNFSKEDGFTPLHLAVDIEADAAWQKGETPSVAMIQLLLELGANPAVMDETGSTPLDIAEEYDFGGAIELLKSK